MLPQLCSQDIILLFLKCRKIHACHIFHINTFFLADHADDRLCRCFLIENAMDIGSAHISRKSTLFFFLPLTLSVIFVAVPALSFRMLYAHMDLIALDLRTGKRSKHTGQLTEMPLHPGPGFFSANTVSMGRSPIPFMEPPFSTP